MKFQFHSKIMLLLMLLALPVTALADALIVSQAMFASTIAEYFVEDDQVRVELEIGINDLAAFRNLLPDTIYQEMGYPPEPLENRLKLLFERDLAIYSNDAPLRGYVKKMGPETRIRRDSVTGEVVPETGAEPEVVIAATLIYRFEQRPESLTFVAPAVTGMVSIGFVLYHSGVAVNDFRFLTNGNTVQLDWLDPWYSSFNSRSLRRQYFAPMAGFIYVEPFEVRKEIIVRPADVQREYDLGLDGVDVITPDMQASVKAGIVEFLDNHFDVTIDGQAVKGTVDRVNFLQRTLRSSIVVDGQNIDLLPASVGVIYVFPTEGLPTEVEMEWDMFNERMPMAAVSAVDQAGPLPSFLEPGYNILKWENFLKNPHLPTLTEIRQPPSLIQKLSHWGQWLFAVIALLALLAVFKSLSKGRGMQITAIGTFLISAGLSFWSMQTWRAVQLDPERLQTLVGNLLHNVYRSFDYRGEEAVYDVLTHSVTGDLLADVYLETRKGLELANQGGAKVKVKTIEMQQTNLRGTNDGAMTIEARWNVAGSVGHWGHIHQRINSYHANVTIQDMDGQWKLSGLEILEEERL
jgi:hypothetical protein